MNESKINPHFIMLIVSIVNGVNYTIAKNALPYINPSAIIIIRGVSSFLFFGLLSLYFKQAITIQKSDYFRLLFASVCGIAINQLLFFNGLHRTTPINAGLLTLLTPIMVSFLSIFFLKTKYTFITLIGLFLSMMGAFLIVSSNGKIQFSSQTALGDFMIIGNASAYAVFLLLVAPLMNKYNPLIIVFWLFTLSIPFTSFVGYKEFMAINWLTIPSKAYWSLVYILIGGTWLAYSANIFVLKYIKPSVASVYIYIQCAIAAIISIIITGEKFTFLKLVAMLSIFIGVYLVGKNKTSKN